MLSSRLYVSPGQEQWLFSMLGHMGFNPPKTLRLPLIYNYMSPCPKLALRKYSENLSGEKEEKNNGQWKREQAVFLATMPSSPWFSVVVKMTSQGLPRARERLYKPYGSISKAL
jgi:hypothetical protein